MTDELSAKIEEWKRINAIEGGKNQDNDIRWGELCFQLTPALIAEVERLTARVDELVPQCDATYAPYRQMVQEARDEVDKFSTQVTALQAENALAERDKRIDTLTTTLANLETQWEPREQYIHDLEKQHEQAMADMERLSAPQPARDTAEVIDRLRTRCEELEAENARLREATCTWTEDDDTDNSIWDTACGEAFVFTDGGPEDNDIRFCCYCGKKLVAVHYEPESEEE